jgi:DNA polymerase III subunit delta
MIIFFHGNDTFRIQKKLKETKDRFSQNNEANSFIIEEIAGEKISTKDISIKIQTKSLFAKKKMIIIKNIFKQKEADIWSKLFQIIKNYQDSKEVFLVFIEEKIENNKLNKEAKAFLKLLKNQTYTQEFGQLDDKQTLNLAKNIFIEKKQKISPIALSSLVSKTGNDLWRLNNEINKLSSLALNRQIEIKDVEENISSEFEEKIFILIDSFFQKKKSLAYKILHEQISAGLSPEYILNMLTRQIRIILEVKSAQKNTPSNKLAENLELHPFVLKKALIQANLFNLEELKKVFNKLVDLEYKNKTGKINLKNELFVLSAQGLLF